MKIKFLIVSMLLSAVCFAQSVKVTVRNPLNIARTGETVELDYFDIQMKVQANTYFEYVVTDAKGAEVPSQILYLGTGIPQRLIFQAGVKANSSAVYTITVAEPKEYPHKAFGRFAPERYDDYIWENDRMAYRIYGTALIAKDGPSNGIDVICKRTPELFMNDLYSDYFEKNLSYHTDHGKGVDAYKVGRSLGCGAMAPFTNAQLWLGKNFISYRTLDNGPVRTSFELRYDTLDVNGIPVIETRIISLDAGSQLNKITETFEGISGTMPVAAGIVLKNAGKVADAGKADPAHTPVLAPAKGYIAYSEVADKSKPDHDNGTIYTAVVFPQTLSDAKVEQQHVLAMGTYTHDTPLTYYTGAGWSKWGFASQAEWIKYIEAFAQKIQQPLEIIW